MNMVYMNLMMMIFLLIKMTLISKILKLLLISLITTIIIKINNLISLVNHNFLLKMDMTIKLTLISQRSQRMK